MRGKVSALLCWVGPDSGSLHKLSVSPNELPSCGLDEKEQVAMAGSWCPLHNKHLTQELALMSNTSSCTRMLPRCCFLIGNWLVASDQLLVNLMCLRHSVSVL